MGHYMYSVDIIFFFTFVGLGLLMLLVLIYDFISNRKNIKYILKDLLSLNNVFAIIGGFVLFLYILCNFCNLSLQVQV